MDRKSLTSVGEMARIFGSVLATCLSAQAQITLPNTLVWMVLLYSAVAPTAGFASSVSEHESLPYEVTIDPHDSSAVLGKFRAAPSRVLFDRTIPLRFKGLDEKGRSLATPADAERLNADFDFFAQFQRITYAALSPDHERIFFSDDSSDSYPWSGYYDIRTGQAWFLARLSADSAVWSPDMKHVALQKMLLSGNSKVFIVDAENPFTPGKPWRGTHLEIGAQAVGRNDGEYSKRTDGAIEETQTHILSPHWKSASTLEFQVLRIKSVPDTAPRSPNLGRGSAISPMSGGEAWVFDLTSRKSSRK